MAAVSLRQIISNTLPAEGHPLAIEDKGLRPNF